tara:strand:+ start:3269 stop:3466 length:198 start_codon:yes stop_codon:yes gene_type:complete
MQQYEIGMKVKFGRPNGQKTVGIIEKVNPKRLKVRTLEQRGINGRSQAGAIWTVPKDARVVEVVQ